MGRAVHRRRPAIHRGDNDGEHAAARDADPRPRCAPLPQTPNQHISLGVLHALVQNLSPSFRASSRRHEHRERVRPAVVQRAVVAGQHLPVLGWRAWLPQHDLRGPAGPHRHAGSRPSRFPDLDPLSSSFFLSSRLVLSSLLSSHLFSALVASPLFSSARALRRQHAEPPGLGWAP